MSELAERPAARERLLAAADELFYAEGVQSVGIDRILRRAVVAKASLYSLFGSKEALVCAYLSRRHAETLARLRDAVEAETEPRARLLAMFDAQARIIAEPGFRGCAFAAACAEAPAGGAVERAARGFRRELRALFGELAGAAEAADSEALAGELQLLHDGVALAARLDGDPAAAARARAAAAALIDAHTVRPELTDHR